MKMGIVFTTAINNPGVSASQLFEAMSETKPLEKVYNSFYELFEDAVINGALGEYENKQIYLIERSKYEFQFNVWLQENKGLEYGNESQYLKFLTKDFFIEFLIQVKKQDSKSTENQHIKAKWSIRTPQQAETSNQYEQSIRVNKLATIKDAERLGCKVGDHFSIIPEPTNIDELFERLHKLHGQHVCESHQLFFSDIYANGNIKIISDQLEKLNEFIEDAESLSTLDTFIEPIGTISMNRIWMIISNRVKDRTNNDERLKLQNDIYLKHLIEYSRLKYGYYENKKIVFSYVTFFSSFAAEVYGKYFLYKQWLEDKLDEFKKVSPTQQTTEQMKENLLQLVACSKGDEIIEEIDKIYLDKSLLTGRKIVLIGDRKDIFKLGEKYVKDGVASISFDEKEYIFPEWKIKNIVDCCKDRLKKLKRRQAEETINVEYNFKSVIITISESCKEIIAHPEQYHILKEHFKGKTDKQQRENHRTAHIISKFNNKISQYIIENQHLAGQSETKKSVGTVDFAVLFNKEKIAIGEAVNSSGQNTNSIDQNIVRHLKKLSRNYNHSSLPDLILLVYYEGNPEKFFDSYDNYLKHFAKYIAAEIKSTKSIDDISLNIVTNSSSIKIAKSIHSYSGNGENEFSIYHFYIDFSGK